MHAGVHLRPRLRPAHGRSPTRVRGRRAVVEGRAFSADRTTSISRGHGYLPRLAAGRRASLTGPPRAPRVECRGAPVEERGADYSVCPGTARTIACTYLLYK